MVFNIFSQKFVQKIWLEVESNIENLQYRHLINDYNEFGDIY
ncbi:MAG: hypothetical protein Satyrvirus14_18 [Satyrvirus sp.]|uniref:Uncharacterized protein n=1 Tax=Satyrvirus sp. TaxID=2487771 RepID=A0A3G5ADZ1_9VIRU|nr:MAG: hypothetical protein Satyrvirus14_18 [Satyrvirus sp.]